MSPRVARAPLCIVLLVAACAVDGGDSTAGDGDQGECTGEKCDDLGESGTGVMVVNPCPMNLPVGLALAGSDFRSPVVNAVIDRGGSTWLAADPGDRIVTTDIGGVGWRTVAYVEERGRLELDPGYCPWDVIIESGTVTDKAADGRDWDPTAVGGFTRPDPYATGFGDGEAVNCEGYPGVEGTPTSTAADTSSPEWNQETLSWIAWHDMSSSIDLVVTDDDVGPGGELIGTCRFENIPTPDALPAVVTSDCGGGGSFTIRIEPADADPVDTGRVVLLGSCS